MIKDLKKLVKKPIFWIFVLALVLRIYKLGSFPVGFHEDEAKVAWNAVSILKTGADDKGSKFSLYYNTFGDYRPTGIFYFTIPSIAIFGRNEFAVRFPSALFGALTVLPIFFLSKELFKKYKWALIASFLLAISPWHIEVSRATSEVAMSTFFAIFAIYFLIRLIKTSNKKYVSSTIISIFIAYFLYHAIRFLAPPFFFITIAFYNKEIRKKITKKFVFICLAFTIVFSVFLSSTPEGKQRFNQVSIFKDVDTKYEIDRIRSENKTKSVFTYIFDNKGVVYLRRFFTEYGSYFSGSFLIGNSARPHRYTTPGAGLLGYLETVLFGIGILEVVKGKKSLLPLMILLIAPLPAAITTEDAPNLHRAFLMLPSIIIMEAYGLEKIVSFSRKNKGVVQLFIFSFLILNFGLFWHMYFAHAAFHKPFIEDYSLDGSSYRNVGTKELAMEINKIQGDYEKIIITNQPDDIYPWYAFFTKKDPKEFNPFAIKRKDGPWQYQNIIFSQLKCPSDDSFREEKIDKLLIVDSGECAYQTKIKDGAPIKVKDRILRSDGSEVYILLERK